VATLDGLAWPEASLRAGAGAILLVPVGATEQHGPHLPLTTDTDIAVAVSLAAAEREPLLVVAPPVSYGSSGEHREFAGTVSIGREATELVLLELCRSAGDHFDRIVLVSTHGGNAVPVARAVSQLRAEHRAVDAWSPVWGGDLHAGRTETSLMLAIAPTRVDMDRAEPGDRSDLRSVLPVLETRGTRAVSANGVLGDPAGAGADEGRHLMGVAVEQLLGVVGDLPAPAAAEVPG
jgi:creatinine amidohydrolase